MIEWDPNKLRDLLPKNGRPQFSCFLEANKNTSIFTYNLHLYVDIFIDAKITEANQLFNHYF